MENITAIVKINTTSNKISDKFKQETSTKTVYVTADADNTKVLKDFGLQLYTSKENNEDFFILKFAAKTLLYIPGEDSPVSFAEEVSTTTPNFTSGDKTVGVNIVKGINMGNEFYRLQALQATPETFEFIKPENPFA